MRLQMGYQLPVPEERLAACCYPFLRSPATLMLAKLLSPPSVPLPPQPQPQQQRQMQQQAQPQRQPPPQSQQQMQWQPSEHAPLAQQPDLIRQLLQQVSQTQRQVAPLPLPQPAQQLAQQQMAQPQAQHISPPPQPAPPQQQQRQPAPQHQQRQQRPPLMLQVPPVSPKAPGESLLQPSCPLLTNWKSANLHATFLPTFREGVSLSTMQIRVAHRSRRLRRLLAARSPQLAF